MGKNIVDLNFARAKCTYGQMINHRRLVVLLVQFHVTHRKRETYLQTS